MNEAPRASESEKERRGGVPVKRGVKKIRIDSAGSKKIDRPAFLLVGIPTGESFAVLEGGRLGSGFEVHWQ